MCLFPQHMIKFQEMLMYLAEVKKTQHEIIYAKECVLLNMY